MYKVILVLFSVSLSVKTIYIVLMITGRKKITWYSYRETKQAHLNQV